jgi:hypothetical protein
VANQDQLASRINQLAISVSSVNRAKVLRITYLVQIIVGLFLSLFGYYLGTDHLYLIRRGVRAPGTIIGYTQELMANGGRVRWDTASMPIVKFQAGDQAVQFKDWMGAKAEVKNVRVTVLYDPENPSLAMIDQPVWNWIPWAPTSGVGLILLLVGTKGWLRSSSGVEA